MPSKETPGCLHTSGRFIYANQVRYSLPLVFTVLILKLFAGLSNQVLWTEVNCVNIKDDCHAWSALGSEPLTLPHTSDVPEEVSIAIHRVEELINRNDD